MPPYRGNRLRAPTQAQVRAGPGSPGSGNPTVSSQTAKSSHTVDRHPGDMGIDGTGIRNIDGIDGIDGTRDGCMTRGLWLVTQAETAWYAAPRPKGHGRRPRLGVQGCRSAHRCARLLGGEPIRAVVSSDLRRDTRTAAAVARVAGVLPVARPELRARSLGGAEGPVLRELPTELSGVAEGWVVDADAAPPGGETVRRFYDRVTGLLGDILAAGTGDAVVVAHGSVAALVLAWLAGLGPDEMAWLPLDSGLVVRREVPVPFVPPVTAPAAAPCLAIVR